MLKKKPLGIVVMCILFSFLAGCHARPQEAIQQTYEKTLPMLPTTQSDKLFQHVDKSVQEITVDTYMMHRHHNKRMYSSVRLWIKRGAPMANGYYFKYVDDMMDQEESVQTYPVVYDNKGLRLADSGEPEDIQKELNHFRLGFSTISMRSLWEATEHTGANVHSQGVDKFKCGGEIDDDSKAYKTLQHYYHLSGDDTEVRFEGTVSQLGQRMGVHPEEYLSWTVESEEASVTMAVTYHHLTTEPMKVESEDEDDFD